MLVNSPLGAVFSLPARRCALAGKLVHSFLSCQVNTDNPYELWFVFGGRPIRFSLAEFEQVTGLPCGAYPSKGHIDKVLKWGPSKAPYWYRLIGPSKSTTISDIVAMLKSDKTMPAWRRFQLALVVLVDGVLICATQPPRPTDGTVEMVKYTNFFLNRYPWGRRSFELTIEMVKIGMKVTTHEELVSKLKKKSLVLHGFPVSIQLFLFQSVPALTRMLPSPHDTRPFKGCHLTKLAKIRCYATYDILECENSPEVEVLNISPLPAGPALDPRRSRCHCGAAPDESFANTGHMKSPGERATASSCNNCVRFDKELRFLRKKIQREIVDLRVSILSEVKTLLAPHGRAGTAGACNLEPTEFDRSPSVQDGCTAAASPPVNYEETTGRTLPQETGVGTNLSAGSAYERTPPLSPVIGLEKAVQKDMVKPVCAMGVHNPRLHFSDRKQRKLESVVGGSTPVCGVSRPCLGNRATVNKEMQSTMKRKTTGQAVENEISVSDAHEYLRQANDTRNASICNGSREKNCADKPGVLDVCSDSGLRSVGIVERRLGSQKRRLVMEDPLEEKVTSIDQHHVGAQNPDYLPFQSVPISLAFNFRKALWAAESGNFHLDGYEVPISFFDEMFTPGNWVSDTHIDYMLRPFLRRFGGYLAGRRLGVVDTVFCTLLSLSYNVFSSSKEKEQFKWRRGLHNIIKGHVASRTEVLKWFQDVDVVYAPMNWGRRHWVVLVISLKECHIRILDPNVPCSKDSKVSAYMKSVFRMLPYLIRSTLEPSLLSEHGCYEKKEFTYERVKGLQVNERGGDCGPMSVKFIEMHSMGYPLAMMSKITDEQIDILRLRYAVQVYEHFIGPVSSKEA